ncbi:MAG TPA: hypothetical protein VFT70_07680 [Nocardioides sp.]|nr:hypothetical protein [Nocardioides sp.]
MTRVPRTRRLQIASGGLLAVLLTSIAACGDDPVPVEPSIGQDEHTETIKALDLVLVTNGHGVARLVGTLVNTSDQVDRLVGIDVDTDIGDFDVVIADGPILLSPNDPFRLMRDGHVTVLSDRLRPGFRPKLTLVFRSSHRLVTTVPVERAVGPYAEVEVTSSPDGDISPD